MNAMTEQVPIEPTAAAIISSANELETSIISAAAATLTSHASVDYISSQRDEIITNNQPTTVNADVKPTE
jgi:hypothetical protein